MTKHVLLLLSVVFFLVTGCQKTELAAPPSTDFSSDRIAATSLNAKGTVSSEKWTGSYDNILDENGLPTGLDPDTYVHDSEFIHNGVASLPALGYPIYTSFCNFYIPTPYHISGDSILMEVSAQNLRSNSLRNYDVILDIVGMQHSIQVHFVADSSAVGNTNFTLGNINKTGLPSLVNYFGTFKTIKLGTKKGQAGVYVDNKLLYRFAYKADNKIGDIYRISLSGKGVPSFDYVKLTNSVTNKKIMQEDFNTEGQSHTIFY